MGATGTDHAKGLRREPAAMIAASLRIRLPADAWVAEVSRSFPRATFRLLTGVRTGETAVELGEIVADDPLVVSRAVAAHDAVLTHRRLETTADRTLAKYETTDTDLYEFLEESTFPPEFPVVVRDGWYELDFTGTREELDGLRSALGAVGRDYELRSLVGVRETEGLLTDRQRETLEAGLREGYFEVPRECSLAALAETLGVDKSSASETLRRGERRVLTRYLTGASDPRSGDGGRHP